MHVMRATPFHRAIQPATGRTKRLGLAAARGLALAQVAMFCAGAAHAQSTSPFPDPNAATKPAAASPFPDPATGQRASPFPPPTGGVSVAPAGGAFGPPPGGGGFAPPQGAGGPSQPSAQQQACITEFNSLREARDNRGKAIQAVMKKKPSPDVACGLFKNYAAAEAKMLTFLKAKSTSCGIPPNLATDLGKGHAMTLKTTNQVCTAAAQPRGPAGPTMSDVLGSPALPAAEAARPKGGSTFDTISGNALAR